MRIPNDSVQKSPSAPASQCHLESLRFLKTTDLYAIDQALSEIGEYGEVRLIISRGHLRFLEKIKTVSLRMEAIKVA